MLDPNHQYVRGWQAVLKMVNEGRSWSGRERHCFFLNTGGPRFADASAAAGLDLLDDGRAVALTDWDYDGDLDMWVINRNGPQVRLMRNQIESDNHFLAVRLQGTECNRDAIGARLELHLDGAEPRKLIKTLHAGDGFIAQSSKWVHFGMGPSKAIQKLVVRWPDRQVQEFPDLEANQRYRIVQGSDVAEPWNPPAEKVHLVAEAPDVPPPTDRARIILGARLPIPELFYRRFDGSEVQITASGDPVLVNLWATWCTPCLGELKDFIGRAGEIRSRGLNVLALSVDEAQDRQTTAQPDQFLSKMGLPFEMGVATAEVLEKLDLLQRAAVTNHKQLPLPTSFLIDGSGRLAAVYKGPVDVDQLLADVRKLDASPEEIRNAAVPIAGRWFSQPMYADQLKLAETFVARGFYEDANRYLEGYLASAGESVDPESESSDARITRKRLPTLHFSLGGYYFKNGKPDKAEHHYLQVLRYRPDLAEAHNDLGSIYQRQDKLDAAIGHYQEALRLDPKLPEAHNNMGTIYYAQHQFRKAERHFRAGLELDPDMAELHNNLGLALAQQGKFSEASAQFSKALRLNPEYADARRNLNAMKQRGGQF